MRTFSGGEAVPAKVLLLSGAAQGPVLAYALLDAGLAGRYGSKNGAQ